MLTETQKTRLRHFALTASINELNELFFELDEEGEKGAEMTRFIVEAAKARFARYNPGFIGKPARESRWSGDSVAR